MEEEGRSGTGNTGAKALCGEGPRSPQGTEGPPVGPALSEGAGRRSGEAGEQPRASGRAFFHPKEMGRLWGF